MSRYRTTFSVPRLWIILSVGMAVMFGTLLALGWEIYQKAPPIPDVVRSDSGQVIYDRENITRGQQVWQSIGGMQQGSIWGHGGDLAPDWRAGLVHRAATAPLLVVAIPRPLGHEPSDQREVLHGAALAAEMRKNTYDAGSGAITVSDNRARAIEQVEKHFTALYQGKGEEALQLRRAYAFPVEAFLTQAEAHDLSA